MYEAVRTIDAYHAKGDVISSRGVETANEKQHINLTWQVDSIVPEDDGDVRVHAIQIKTTLTEGDDDKVDTETQRGRRKLWAEIPREMVVALYRDLDA